MKLPYRHISYVSEQNTQLCLLLFAVDRTAGQEVVNKLQIKRKRKKMNK